MILVTATVEDDFLDTGFLGALREHLADDSGSFRPGFARDLRGNAPVDCRGRHQCVANSVVDHLGIDARQAAEHVQTWTGRRADDTRAHAAMTPIARCMFLLECLRGCHRDYSLLTRLARLATDLLAGIAYALAQIRLRRTQFADVRRDLADDLLVDAVNVNRGRITPLDRERDVFGRCDDDLV